MQHEKSISDTIADLLMQLKRDKKISQKQVAEESGYSKGYINRLFNRDPEANPTAAVLTQIQKVHQKYFSIENNSESNFQEETNPYSAPPPLTRFGGNREGAITGLSSPVPSDIGADASLSVILGDLWPIARDEAIRRRFSSVGEYVKYIVRQDIESGITEIERKTRNPSKDFNKVADRLDEHHNSEVEPMHLMKFSKQRNRPDMSDPEAAKQAANLKPPTDKK